MYEPTRFRDLLSEPRTVDDQRWLIGPHGILAAAQQRAATLDDGISIGDCDDLFAWLDDHCVVTVTRPSERARAWFAVSELSPTRFDEVRRADLPALFETIAVGFPLVRTLQPDLLPTTLEVVGDDQRHLLDVLIDHAVATQDVVLDDMLRAVHLRHRSIRREIASVPFAVSTRHAGEVLLFNVVRTYGQPSIAVDLESSPFLEADAAFVAAVTTAWEQTGATTIATRWSARFEVSGHPVERVNGPSVGLAAAVAFRALVEPTTRIDRDVVFTGRIEPDGAVTTLWHDNASHGYGEKIMAVPMRTLVVPAADVALVQAIAQRISRPPKIAGLQNVDGISVLLDELDSGSRSPMRRVATHPTRPRTRRDGAEAFAGRIDETNYLVDTLSRSGYAPRLVLVSGGPGVGKTRLLARCVDACREARSTLVFTCDTPSSHRAEVLAALDEQETFSPASTASRQRAIVLDDAHLADVAILQRVRDVMSRSDTDLVIVLSYRDDVELHHELLALGNDARRGHPLITSVNLAALSAAEVSELVGAVLVEYSEAECEAIADRLWQACAGHTLSTVLVLNIARHSERAALTERMLRSAGRDDLLDQIVRQCCALVQRRDVLTAAAILGVEFDYEGLRSLTQLDDEVLLENLATATELRLVSDVADDSDRYRFAHGMVRDVVYADAARARLALLHSRAAEYFESTMQDGPVRNALLAHHYSMVAPAMHADLALRYTLAAAKDAAALRADDDAERWYEKAVELAGVGSGIVPLVDAQLGLGRVRRRRGDPSGRAILLGACRRAIEANRHDLLVDGVVAAHRGFFSRATSVDTEWVEVIERALTIVTDGATRAELLAVLANELTWASDGDRRFELADEALELALQHGSQRTIADIRYRRSLTVAALDTVAERDANSRALLDLAAGDLGASDLARDELRFMAAITRATVAAEVGQMSEALVCVSDAERYAASMGDAMIVFTARLARAGSLLTQGHLDLAQAVSREAYNIGQAAEQGGDAAILHGEQLWEIRRLRGNHRALRDQASLIAGAGDSQIAVLGARYLVEINEVDLARSAYDEIRTRGASQFRRGLTEPPAVRDLATLAIRFLDLPTANDLYDRLLASADHFANTTVVRPCGAHYLGGLASVLGRAAETEHWFRYATRRHESQHAPLLTAETLIEWARGEDRLRMPGYVERAERHLDAASEIVAAHDAIGLEQVVVRLRAGLGTAT